MEEYKGCTKITLNKEVYVIPPTSSDDQVNIDPIFYNQLKMTDLSKKNSP